MGDLSKDFSRHEFACACGCGMDTVDAKLLALLQAIRDHFDATVHITSGNRCVEYNAEIGGSRRSQHIFSRAADIVVRNVPPSIVQELAIQLGATGVGKYSDFTHIDTRTGSPVEWSG